MQAMYAPGVVVPDVSAPAPTTASSARSSIATGRSSTAALDALAAVRGALPRRR
jgi:hypothetical protein